MTLPESTISPLWQRVIAQLEEDELIVLKHYGRFKLLDYMIAKQQAYAESADQLEAERIRNQLGACA